MSGLFSVGGLVSGLDSNTLISQIIQLDRAPITRFEERIGTLEKQRDAIRELRTLLTDLRNKAQDFRFSTVFNAFKASTSEEKVLTAEISSANPVSGAFEINVSQLASATTARSSGALGAAIDPDATLENSGISATIEPGTLKINGVEFPIDPAAQSLNDVLNAINASSAGVTATYNAGTDTVTFENTAPGDTGVINFGASGDTGTSNLLAVLAVTQATQTTNLNGSTSVTSTRNMGAIDATGGLDAQNFALGAVSAGTFTINGIAISVDPALDTLQDVLGRINSSEAQVTASYDSSADTIRFVSKTLGSRTIKFGGTSDTSNFLAVSRLDTAVQTAGKDAQFTVNGGAVQTRSTNAVSDAISGVTLNLLSLGTSTVTVASDDDAIVEKVRAFIDKFNESVNKIRELTGSAGALSGDGGIRAIESYLRTNIFGDVPDAVGSFRNLLAVGISTGKDFSATESAQLSLDEDAFREALRKDRLNVEQLFANDVQTGIGDVLFTFLDDATRTTGYLNGRAKANGTIDQQIQGLKDQIARLEERLDTKEARLRRQFAQMERLSSSLQSQSASLSNLSFRGF